ncbi:MAG: hypothetical protein IJ300_01875 [Clostridia bacterium]|nr:hypothetical protein [Clostridia bacterium]
MLNLTVQSNSNNTEIAIETNELKFLLDIMEQQKNNCLNTDLKTYESIYNKIKALYLFDKRPDIESIHQIKNLFLSSEETTKENIKIENLPFSIRTFHCLDRANIKTLGELLCYTQEDLLRIRNLGIQSLNEIIEILNTYDLKLPVFTNE